MALLLAAAVMAFGLTSCGKPQQQAKAQKQKPPDVTVAKPVTKQVREWDDYTGRFDAVDTVDLRARVSGVLDEVHFTDGEAVKKGQLLFVIDPRPFERAVDQAKAQEWDAQTRVKFATRDVDRARPLLERKTISEQAFDERLKEQQQAEAALKSATAQRRTAELNLEFTKIRAPIAGRASRHLISVGNFVTGGSSQGTLLTTIVTLDPIYFYFDVSEAAYLKYTRLDRLGQRPSSRDTANPVYLSLKDETGFPHEGKMNFVDNRLDSDTDTIRGRAVFDNPDKVFAPGLFARIRLIGSGKYEAVMVPDSAVGTDQTSKFVYVVDDKGKVAQKHVTLGPIIDGLRVVKDGISGNDSVIIKGVQRAKDGGMVTPQPGDIKASQPQQSADAE